MPWPWAFDGLMNCSRAQFGTWPFNADLCTKKYTAKPFHICPVALAMCQFQRLAHIDRSADSPHRLMEHLEPPAASRFGLGDGEGEGLAGWMAGWLAFQCHLVKLPVMSLSLPLSLNLQRPSAAALSNHSKALAFPSYFTTWSCVSSSCGCFCIFH